MEEPDEPVESLERAEFDEPPRAVRLNFAFEGDRIELMSRMDTEKLIPPQPSSGESPPAFEFAAELRAADGRVLYAVPVCNPTSPNMEVFGESEIARIEVKERKGAFTVLVPALEDGDRVALVSRQPPGRDPALGLLSEPELVMEVALRDERTDPA